MKRLVASATLAVGLAFASLAGTTTAYAAQTAPVVAVHHKDARIASHTESIQIPSIRRLPRHLSFGELTHPWRNLVRRPRIEARRAAVAAKQAASVNLLSTTASGPWPGGAFGACVVMRESGGNPQIMNASGHYGLYQFSEQTWVAYGGNPADFGHASVAEQEQVFMNALAAGGESNWAPYDGC